MSDNNIEFIIEGEIEVELVEVKKDVKFSKIQKIEFLHQSLKDLIDYHYSTNDMGYTGLLRSVEDFYLKMTEVLNNE